MVVDAIISQPITIAIKTAIFVFIIPRILAKLKKHKKEPPMPGIEMSPIESTDSKVTAASVTDQPQAIVIAPAAAIVIGTSGDEVVNDIDEDTIAVSFKTLSVDPTNSGAPSRQNSLSQHDQIAVHHEGMTRMGFMPPSSDEESGDDDNGSGDGEGDESGSDDNDGSDSKAPVVVGASPEMKRAPTMVRAPTMGRQPTMNRATSAASAARANGPGYSSTGGAGTRVLSSVGTAAIMDGLSDIF
jgi:hypothetical protein